MGDGSIRYDARSFIINGRREFLTSGSIHYFRVPRELWRDRLEKARAFGLNTIQTYVAWNWHEREEGTFDFTGDRDLDTFLDLCAELGFYVVARPGPYICAEWDFGGFPAWLLTKRGIRIRHHDPVYLGCVDRWFEQLIPVIARHQVTHGGTVILVQIENELGNVVPEAGDAAGYMAHLGELVRRLGVDVPLVTCAGQAEGAIEAINSHRPADAFPEFRRRQPNVPLHCTEFWSAWYQTWHRQRQWTNKTADDLAYHTWRVIAEGGAGYNYYMWHGGTNFGYTTMYLQTTSYDFDAPLSEAGGIGERGRKTIPPAHFARSFSFILADSDAACISDASGASIWERRNSYGRLLFIENRTDATITTEPIHADDVTLGPITVAPRSVRPVIAGVDIAAGTSLYTASFVHGVYRAGDRINVVLTGPPGEEVACCLRKDGAMEVVSGRIGEEPEILGACVVGGLDVRAIAAPDGVAGRVWHVGRRLVIGARYARQVNAEGVQILRDAGDRAWVVSDAVRAVLPAEGSLPELPSFRPWTVRRGDAEVQPWGDDRGWIASFRAVARDLVGDHAGYGWYRARYRSREARRAVLHIDAVSDRALVFLNGRHVTTTIEPVEDRRFQPSVTVPVDLVAGENALAVLVDNLGHVKGDWQLDELGHRDARTMRDDLKGILGRVWFDHDEVLGWQMRAGLEGERDRWYTFAAAEGWDPLQADDRAPLRWFRTTFLLNGGVLRFGADRPLRVRVTGLGKGCLWVNDHHLGRYWNINGHTDYFVPSPWLDIENTLVLFEETDASPADVRLVWDAVAAMADITVLD